MAKQRRSAEKESFWRLALAEFRASGLSVRAFCAREGLSQTSFYAWRRSLQQRDSEPARVELTTPGGFTLCFPSDIGPRQLGALLGVIEPQGATRC